MAEAKCIAVNPLQPELLAVGCNDPFIRVYDHRMLTTYNSMEGRRSSEDLWLPEGCVQYFAPGHLPPRLNREFSRRFRAYVATYITFSPDGKTLAIGCTDNTIKLWDINSENNFQSIEGHTNKILSVVFSPDGKILASGSVDETVKLWDIQTKKCLKTFHWDNDGVHGVAISSDGKILAAGGRNGIIKIWNVQTGECIKTLSNKPYANMNITNATGLTPEQKSSLKALGAMEE